MPDILFAQAATPVRKTHFLAGYNQGSRVEDDCPRTQVNIRNKLALKIILRLILG